MSKHITYTLADFSENDYGKLGKMFENAFTHTFVKSAGRSDWRKGKNYEIKQNAGTLAYSLDSRMIKGSSRIIYAPYVVLDGNVMDLSATEAFVVERETFIEILSSLGLIREKTATNGKRVLAIQTVWNYKKNAPHSKKKYNELVNALYDNCIMTLEDFLEEEGLT